MANDKLPDAWWKDITFDELAQASGVISRFQAAMSMDSRAENETSPSPVASADRVARAILLRRLAADDRSLEGLVQLAEAAGVELRKAVVARTDLRGDDSVVASRRLSESLRPVLLRCGQMLLSRSTDGAGKEALDAAENLRELLFDYNLLAFRYGIRT